MFYVYVIQSTRDQRLYVGMTSDPRKRFSDHNAGKVFSTKGYRPWILVHVDPPLESRVKAREREKYLKSGIGKEYLKSILKAEVAQW